MTVLPGLPEVLDGDQLARVVLLKSVLNDTRPMPFGKSFSMWETLAMCDWVLDGAWDSEPKGEDPAGE